MLQLKGKEKFGQLFLGRGVDGLNTGMGANEHVEKRGEGRDNGQCLLICDGGT